MAAETTRRRRYSRRSHALREHQGPRPRASIDLATCRACGGAGYTLGVEIEMVCCGNVLPTGECCSAMYGTDRLVPEEQQVQIPCDACGGSGEAGTP